MATTLRKARAFRSQGSEGRRAILEVALVSTLVSAGFRLLGVARTQSLLRRWATATSVQRRQRLPEVHILSVRRAQGIVWRNLGTKGTCLTRSLTLWALLLRRGVETNLRVGFRKSEGKLEGHAWVEHHGIALNEAPDVSRKYTAFTNPAAFDARYKPEYWR
jgi:hypothetical protein